MGPNISLSFFLSLSRYIQAYRDVLQPCDGVRRTALPDEEQKPLLAGGVGRLGGTAGGESSVRSLGFSGGEVAVGDDIECRASASMAAPAAVAAAGGLSERSPGVEVHVDGALAAQYSGRLSRLWYRWWQRTAVHVGDGELSSSHSLELVFLYCVCPCL